MSKPVICADCGAPMVLRKSTRFRNPFYGCSNYPECKGAHGAHPDGRPLGTPASTPTKKKRIEAHESFDKLWQQGLMSRKNAYRKVSELLGMEEMHIGGADIALCERIIEVSKNLFAEETRKSIVSSESL